MPTTLTPQSPRRYRVLAFHIHLHLDPRLYVRDPEETDLGRRIVDAAIRLIDGSGFERFTFRALAKSIRSTEASIYRYFENKHRLLLYLTSWYWSWVDYRLEFRAGSGDPSPRERLHRIVDVLLQSGTYDPTWSHIDEVALHRIVVVESHKVYQTQWVDADDAEALFSAYQALVAKVGDVISAASPRYAFPIALASTLIEAAHQQIFFCQHLPSLTDVELVDGKLAPVRAFLADLLDRALGLSSDDETASASENGS